MSTARRLCDGEPARCCKMAAVIVNIKNVAGLSGFFILFSAWHMEKYIAPLQKFTR